MKNLLSMFSSIKTLYIGAVISLVLSMSGYIYKIKNDLEVCQSKKSELIERLKSSIKEKNNLSLELESAQTMILKYEKQLDELESSSNQYAAYLQEVLNMQNTIVRHKRPVKIKRVETPSEENDNVTYYRYETN